MSDLTIDERAELERLRAERAEHSRLTFKVGQKGGVSVYGLGRFPVTLYVEQWESLFEALPELKAFIAENEHRLARKER